VKTYEVIFNGEEITVKDVEDIAAMIEMLRLGDGEIVVRCIRDIEVEEQECEVDVEFDKWAAHMYKVAKRMISPDLEFSKLLDENIEKCF